MKLKVYQFHWVICQIRTPFRGRRGRKREGFSGTSSAWLWQPQFTEDQRLSELLPPWYSRYVQPHAKQFLYHPLSSYTHTHTHTHTWPQPPSNIMLIPSPSRRLWYSWYTKHHVKKSAGAANNRKPWLSSSLWASSAWLQTPSRSGKAQLLNIR